MEYSFDVQEAIKYGVDEAIMLRMVRYWIQRNKANGKNEREGRTWTYNTQEAYAQLYPFWSRRAVQRILANLEEKKALVSVQFGGANKAKAYAFSDESLMHQTVQHGGQPVDNPVDNSDSDAPNGAARCTEPCSVMHETVLHSTTVHKLIDKPIPDARAREAVETAPSAAFKGGRSAPTIKRGHHEPDEIYEVRRIAFENRYASLPEDGCCAGCGFELALKQLTSPDLQGEDHCIKCGRYFHGPHIGERHHEYAFIDKPTTDDQEAVS